MPEAIQRAAGLSVVDKLRMLLDITKKISRSLDLDEVLNVVMDTLDSLIPYDAAGIYLVKCSRPLAERDGEPDETCVFHTEAVRGYDIADLQELRLKMGEGLIGHVAVSGKPYIARDVRNDPRYINARARTRSEMVAPIISNEEVIGVFDLESDELDAYSDDDLEVLMLLASQVAIIIDKVMLHEQLIEKQRLETQLEVARQVQLELLPPRDPPLLIDADGKARFEERGGVPLGMFRDSRYYEYYATIEPGQMLVLYTDGVTEAMNPSGEEYGSQRLVAAALRGRDLSARELIDLIHRDVIDWTDGRGAHDDVTFFIIKAL